MKPNNKGWNINVKGLSKLIQQRPEIQAAIKACSSYKFSAYDIVGSYLHNSGKGETPLPHASIDAVVENVRDLDDFFNCSDYLRTLPYEERKNIDQFWRAKMITHLAIGGKR